MGTAVRFNDLLQTVLAAPADGQVATVTLWRQCVDLLAQNDRADRAAIAPRDAERLLERLAALRERVDLQQRMATVVELGSRLRSPRLIAFLAADVPAVAVAALSRARLPDGAWPDIISRVGPTGRGALRGRSDLGTLARRALDSFGPVDLVLRDESGGGAAAPLPPPPPVARDGEQIRRLVDRIEQFTSARAKDGGAARPDSAEADAIVRFQFETDAQGHIVAIAGAPRAAAVGLSIADAGLDAQWGPDGHAQGAFRRRGAFRDARFGIETGALAGEWLLSGAPRFEPSSGRFTGYDGVARRPSPHERAPRGTAEESIEALSAGSMRQLIHELRTPLNAIIGFAEIIAGQLFGPASESYRAMAAQIIADAGRLLAIFDDLDLASRVTRGDDGARPRLIQPGSLIERAIATYRGEGSAPRIGVAVAEGLPQVRVDPAQGERMVLHLVRTLVAVSAADETLTIDCREEEGRVVIAASRPRALDGLDEQALLDPGYGPDGDWPDGPLLGVGFAFRLIRSLARNAGGSFDFAGPRFVLGLPVAQRRGEAQP